MSFRARLTTFFLLIVVVPMAAMGFLVFRLISDSQQAKAEARVNGIASAAASLYDAGEPVREPRRPHGGPCLSAYAGGQLRPERPLCRRRWGSSGSPCPWAGGRWPTSAPGTRSPPGSPRQGQPGARARVDHPVRAERVAVRQPAHRARLRRGCPPGQPDPGHDAARGCGAATYLGPDRSASTGARYQTATLNFSGFGASPVQVTVLSDNSVDRRLAWRPTGSWPRSSSSPSWLWPSASRCMASRALHISWPTSWPPLAGWAAATSPRRSPPTATTSSPRSGTEFNNMSAAARRPAEELEREQQRVRRSIRYDRRRVRRQPRPGRAARAGAAHRHGCRRGRPRTGFSARERGRRARPS